MPKGPMTPLVNLLSIARRFAPSFLRLALISAMLVGSVSAPSVVLAQPPVDTVVVATDFSQAIGATNAGDGSGRIFVVQQSGEIRIWDGSQVFSTPFLDVSALITPGGEQGLLGLAFHPDYETNGFFYINYIDLAGDTVVARYSVSAGDPNVANPASAFQVLGFGQPFGNHNGGDMHFGPDGYLYIASGDGGDNTTGQDMTNPLGGLLRIDVDTDDFPAEPDRNYGIPADNPLVGVAGAAEELWSMGLRNPWRFSFDRLTGDIFIGDVGDGAWEEVDFEPAGTPFVDRNYGWPCYEGDAIFDGCGMAEDFTFPILTLPHEDPPDNNCSVIGGFRYRGSDYSLLQGWYFYKDWCTGTLWAAEPDGLGGWSSFKVEELGGFGFTGFAEGEDGELYLAGGFELLQIVDPTQGIFTDGFESGDTTAWSGSVP